MLVLAGAGSGKTRAITYRLAYLIRHDTPPWNVLAITFTNKAAEEMRRRVEALNTPRGATLCTFHSLCAALLREFADRAGIRPNYSIYDRDDQVRLVKEAMTRAAVPVAAVVPTRVLAKISHAKNSLQTPAALAEAAAGDRDRQVAEVYRRYEELLTANNALDFDDLLLRMAFVLRDNADVCELLGRRYQYVMIDEYQDTNHAQYLLARAITLRHRNLAVTGDPDQSIYAWRGADISNILEFENDYPDAKVIRMEENYRSTRAILHTASNLITHNVMRKDKALWTQRPGGPNVRLLYCNDEHDEAARVAGRIGKLRDAGVPCENITVFYRLNSLSRVIEQAFLAAALPYRVARGLEFFNRKEVRDLLAYLKLLVNPDDDVSCLRIINTPARGIGSVTIDHLRRHARRGGGAILSTCACGLQAGLKPPAAKKALAFAKLIESLQGLLEAPVPDVVNHVIEEVDFRQALASREEPRDSPTWANVMELVNTAAEFDQARQGGSLAEFLHQVSLVSDADHFDGGDGAVTLMTLHAAKGLEFPVVFIVGCEDSLLPLKRGDEPDKWSQASRARYEEERRLAFVGMTRAMDELTLSCARRRMVRGRTTPQAASPFLEEIGTDFVTVEDLTTPAPSAAAHRRLAGRFYTDGSSDADQRRIIEAMEVDAEQYVPSQYTYLRPGCRVYHPKFGPGLVTNMGTQRWPDTRIDVLFDDCGPKRIVLKHADLELIGQ
jgi:DNA helicase-2/ATP-dependent DNA helicase PcrA